MMNAPTAELRFCCPNCGVHLRAAKDDGGTVIPCRGCGEAIRVPRNIPIQECLPSDADTLSPIVVRRTVQGVRLLRICNGLTVLQGGYVFAVYGLWLSLVGAPKLWQREADDYRNLFFALWMFDLGVVAALSCCKWIGYQRCEAAADAVESLGRLTLTRFAVLLRGLGYALAAIPWLTTNSAEGTPWSMNAAVQVGHVLWFIALPAEYSILFVWHRLLSERTSGGERIVTRLLAWTAGLVLTAATALSLVGMTLMATLRSKHADRPGTPPRLDLAAMTDQDWSILIGPALFLAALSAVSILLYDRVLRRVIAALMM